MKFLIAALVAWLLVLQYQLWLAPGGLIAAWKLKKNIHHQLALNNTLKQRNEEIAADIRDLKAGNEAIEQRARHEIGMIKKDERFYQVVK